MTDDRDQLIRERAHALWEAEGRPDGRDRDHWEQACREIDGTFGTVTHSAWSTEGVVPPKPSDIEQATGVQPGGTAPGGTGLSGTGLSGTGPGAGFGSIGTGGGSTADGPTGGGAGGGARTV